MKLEDVMQALREGKKVTRRYWQDDEFIQLVGVTVEFTCGEGFTLGSGMLEADDWEVIEEKRELSWEEIEKALTINVIYQIVGERPHYIFDRDRLKERLGFTD